MRLSKRERILIAILVLAASIALFLNFVYTPGQNRLNELAAELESNRKVLAELKKMNNEAAKHLQEVKNIDNEIRVLEKKMPGNMDLPGIAVEFYGLLTGNRLAGDEIILGDVITGEKYDFYTISFNAEGKREDIDSFLRQLESLKTEISIAGLDLKAADQDNFKMSLKINVYMFNSDKKSVYTPDYYFMDESNGTYRNWYEMFKVMEMVKDTDKGSSGGSNGS